ncbi:MAG: type II secretion system F family protein [Mariniblastus sp.]|nr:type II secretion system F family protein [Mariniblastus sp.]
MLIYVLLGAVVIGAAGMVYGASMLLSNDDKAVNSRLDALTSNRGRGLKQMEVTSNDSVLKSPLDDSPSHLEQFLSRLFNLSAFIEQSGLKISITNFFGMSLGMGFVLGMVFFLLSPMKSAALLAFATGSFLPLGYIWFVRRRRLKIFGKQLPEALDLMTQALRAGQSLPAGIQLVAQQMQEPLGPEFKRCYEQQNLGVALEDSLNGMTERIPNLDLQFFATSVMLQRQTGGDLAEILDKIAKLIRERLQIWGQIQALTGEGRLSGIVLLALPPALFLVMLKLNYSYVMMLFEEPLGQKMLAVGIVMQLLGAVAIKKIITIKV